MTVKQIIGVILAVILYLGISLGIPLATGERLKTAFLISIAFAVLILTLALIGWLLS